MDHLQERLRQLSLTGLLCLAGLPALGHGVVPNMPTGDRAIHFPDIAGYKTLVLDLHTHSVFFRRPCLANDSSCRSRARWAGWHRDHRAS